MFTKILQLNNLSCFIKKKYLFFFRFKGFFLCFLWIKTFTLGSSVKCSFNHNIKISHKIEAPIKDILIKYFENWILC